MGGAYQTRLIASSLAIRLFISDRASGPEGSVIRSDQGLEFLQNVPVQLPLERNDHIGKGFRLNPFPL